MNSCGCWRWHLSMQLASAYLGNRNWGCGGLVSWSCKKKASRESCRLQWFSQVFMISFGCSITGYIILGSMGPKIIHLQLPSWGESQTPSFGKHTIWVGSSQLYRDEVCSDGGQDGSSQHPEEVQVWKGSWHWGRTVECTITVMSTYLTHVGTPEDNPR